MKISFENELFEPDLLPKEVIWRTKEAFSDGVSSQEKSWYQIIQHYVEEQKSVMMDIDESTYPNHMIPETYEQKYYYQIFSNNFIDKIQIW